MRIFLSALLSLATASTGFAEEAGAGSNVTAAAASRIYYTVESPKPFEKAAADLSAAVQRNGFGVLHIHDLGATLRRKGIDFTEQCKVFEVCNPRQAGRVLATDMRLNMALPCRISVYTEDGKTMIGMIRPTQVLAGLSKDPAMAKIAGEVEAKTARMIDEAG